MILEKRKKKDISKRCRTKQEDIVIIKNM